MQSLGSWPRLHLAGDSAWLVDFGERTDDAVNNATIAFDARVRGATIEGVSETAPTIRSVLVRFDPLVVDAEALRGRLADWLAERDWLASQPPAGRKRWHVPVCYGGPHGPDLGEVVDLLKTDEASVVAEHAATLQRVRMVGFAPGFVYAGLLGERWNLPRRTEVRAEVPPGSLAVAVRQTVFTSTAIPTGWRVIGCSPFRAFQLEREPTFVLAAGDELSFEPVDPATFDALEKAAAAGEAVARAEVLP
ncbi:MAG: allophanate hydrolase subunit 1 [Pseudomonadota bacterium]